VSKHKKRHHEREEDAEIRRLAALADRLEADLARLEADEAAEGGAKTVLLPTSVTVTLA